MLQIKPLYEEDAEQVKDFVLNIENNEFGLGFQPHEQPDLYNLESFYKAGGFWIARLEGAISGTIGLQKLSHEVAIMRHLFVEKDHRGTNTKIAQSLFRQMLMYAKLAGFKDIYLSTPDIAIASQKFFLRNDFQEIADPSLLAVGHKFMDRNSKLYHLTILCGSHFHLI